LAFDLALETPDAIEAVVASSPRISGCPWRDPGVRTVALANAAAQFDPWWREQPPAAVDRLDELRAAALLIVGEEDIAEVGEIADLVAAPFPGASKRVVAETDQLVNVGKPERLDRLALDFLAFAG
jgi:hypothetical protein